MSKHRQTGRAPATRRARLTGLVALSGCLCLLLAACSGGLRQSADEGSSGAGSGCDRSASYPSGPVEMVVPWDAGGGTDSVARFVGAQLAKSLDTQVNVVNRTGGSGAVGHSAIAGAPPDGSTIGMATVEITMMHWQGLTELNHEQLTPIAQVNSDPAGITVRADAPWDDAKSLIEDARKNPGSLTASGTGVAGIWDLARAGMLMESGVDTDAIRWVPSDGAAPALQELVAGGIDVSFASLAENQTMLRSGRVKALGVMGDKPD
ncbi:MAG: tripartite tricarboxylate transporter substrate binding protein, partial [Nocardioidaceae bacterium]